MPQTIVDDCQQSTSDQSAVRKSQDIPLFMMAQGYLSELAMMSINSILFRHININIRSASGLQHRLVLILLASMNSRQSVSSERKLSLDNKHPEAGAYLTNMVDQDVCEICFLSDMLHHLNVLNLGFSRGIKQALIC